MSAALLALMWGCGGGDEIGSGAPGDTVAGGSARTGVSAREEAGAPDGDSGDARGDAAAGAKAGRRKPRNEQPDLLLVSLDTLRADRLHCYGNENATSPNIDFFANKGLRFAACIAPSPNTAPSHMTLFTGISPLAHGVRNTSVGDESLTRVNATIPLISELVQEAGYQTLSVREHGQLDGRKGFDRASTSRG
ncbi:MAG: sulfatase-like hydrolase/transferase [Planctomycetota bacterium]